MSRPIAQPGIQSPHKGGGEYSLEWQDKEWDCCSLVPLEDGASGDFSVCVHTLSPAYWMTADSWTPVSESKVLYLFQML